MTKKQIRKYFRQKRAELSVKELLKLEDLLLIRFQQWALPDMITLLSYLPIKERAEVNTHIFTDYVSFRIPGLRLAYPVMDTKENQLKPVLVHDETAYQENSFGIAEPVEGDEISPTEIDAVLVPLLAFDEKGFRVGYGKGYYDRFLAQCRTDVMKIGFSYFEPLPSIEDINEFDVPLSLCITPNKLYEF